MAKLLLIVSLAGERVAVSAAQVEAVVEIDAVAPVPRAAPHVAGLAALRSRVLTVIDCAASLETGRSNRDGVQDAIVAEVDGYPYALLVERVEDVVEYEGELGPVRTALAPGWKRVSRGVVEVGGQLLLLIDVHAILSGPAAQAA